MISLLLDETGLEDSLVDNYLRHKRSSEMRHVKKVAYRKEPFTASKFFWSRKLPTKISFVILHNMLNKLHRIMCYKDITCPKVCGLSHKAQSHLLSGDM